MRDIVFNDYIYVAMAARWTIALSLIAFGAGGLIGAILVFARISRRRVFRAIATAFVNVVQGTPLLIQLFIWYFGLGIVGANLSPLIAAGAGISVWSSAFFSEIWRGAVVAIPKPQWEASAALGLRRMEQMRYVIVPQAIRAATPPTVGFMVQIVKNTSLAALVGFVELARAAQIINNATFEPFSVFGLVAAIYFLICFPMSLLARALERRSDVGRPAPQSL